MKKPDGQEKKTHKKIVIENIPPVLYGPPPLLRERLRGKIGKTGKGKGNK